MTDSGAPQPGQESHSPRGEIPTHVISLRAEREAAPDQISTLAVLAMLVALLGTTCMPLLQVLSIMASTQSVQADETVERQEIDPSATSQPQQQFGPQVPRPMPEIPVISLAMVLVFFLVAVLGLVGGFGTLLRRQWGRRLLMAFAALVLLYLIAAVYLRLRFGIEGLTQTAPTASALSLNLTCVFAVFLLVATLMIVILRYLSQPHIARRFH